MKRNAIRQKWWKFSKNYRPCVILVPPPRIVLDGLQTGQFFIVFSLIRWPKFTKREIWRKCVFVNLHWYTPYIFEKKKKENKRVKKNKTCVKFFPNVVKNRVFGQKLYFHCMPIYEVINSGQNTNFFLPSFWAPQKNAFF